MKLLITGALGHIGSRFLHTIHPGTYDEVVVLDNLSTQRYCSLFNLPTGAPFRFVEADVCKADLESLFAGIDTVIHLAAITDAANSFAIQSEVERVNLGGTERVARACVAQGCRMAFVSTTSVYGSQEDEVDEGCPLEQLRPQSPYAKSKLRAEQLLQEMGRASGLRFLICRLGTIFGCSPGMRFHTAVNKFVWQACVGEPLTVWRTAMKQRRPYLDVRDAVNALDFLLKRELFDGRIWNVVTANKTVEQIVRIISSRVEDVVIKYVDSPVMNQLSYTVRSDRLRTEGFEFTGDLEAGILESIELLSGVRQLTARLAAD